MVWPPVTTPCTPKPAEQLDQAAAAATATTAQVVTPAPGGRLTRRAPHGLLPHGVAPPRPSYRSVTRIFDGRPPVQGDLDGRADVVGVHMAVPQPLAADDDDRVADPGPTPP